MHTLLLSSPALFKLCVTASGCLPELVRARVHVNVHFSLLSFQRFALIDDARELVRIPESVNVCKHLSHLLLHTHPSSLPDRQFQT